MVGARAAGREDQPGPRSRIAPPRPPPATTPTVGGRRAALSGERPPSGAAGAQAGGISTRVMTWIVPLEAATSVWVTLAVRLRNTLRPRTLTLTFGPASVFTDLSFTTWAAFTLPATTW